MKAAGTQTAMIKATRQSMFFIVIDRETHVDEEAAEFNGTP